eukprot:754876-Hanusia_phi.AAC.1
MLPSTCRGYTLADLGFQITMKLSAKMSCCEFFNEWRLAAAEMTITMERVAQNHGINFCPPEARTLKGKTVVSY